LSDEALRDGVAAVLGDLGLGAGAPSLRVLGGGASRQTFLVESGELTVVLRRDPPGSRSFNPLALEVAAMQAAAAAGVPVPRLLRFEPEGGRFESAGILMERVEGTSVGPRLLRRDEYAEARMQVPRQLAAALAGIHSVDADSVAGLPGDPGADPALAACDLWGAALADWGHPQPVLEAGLRWLRLHAPDPAPQALVHGDFRLGNFIASADGLQAVIDWELCHRGDPCEDIGWLCIRSWRFGNDGLPVAGMGERDPFLDAYVAAGGVRPDAERLRWWEAMGNVKWAVICARQAQDHVSGIRRSHELASLGRRICEPEWDLLELLAPAGI
jgi:aminoglycoside phosphotransferase (APT) family kinase protein